MGVADCPRYAIGFCQRSIRQAPDARIRSCSRTSVQHPLSSHHHAHRPFHLMVSQQKEHNSFSMALEHRRHLSLFNGSRLCLLLGTLIRWSSHLHRLHHSTFWCHRTIPIRSTFLEGEKPKSERSPSLRNPNRCGFINHWSHARLKGVINLH